MSEQYEIILLQPFGMNQIGDMISVNRGLYSTLIKLKKAVPSHCYDEVENKEKMVINAKYLEEEIEEYFEENTKLNKENEKLKKKIEELNKLKDKRTRRKVPNKKIKEALVETKLLDNTIFDDEQVIYDEYG